MAMECVVKEEEGGETPIIGSNDLTVTK